MDVSPEIGLLYGRMEFNIHEAKTQFSKLLDLAQEGEEVAIIRNGQPVAEFIPARKKGALVVGSARATIEAGPIAVSVASFWEMVNKKGRGIAPLAEPVAWWNQYVIRREIPIFAIRYDHVAQLDAMHWPHQDPYDRILSAQAIVEGATLITADNAIRANTEVQTLW